MQTLNLINKENSTINYTIDKFPDGQINIHIHNINRKDTIKIISRIVSSDDIFILMQIQDILSRNEIEVSQIVIPYLLCARQDRVIDFEQSFSLKIISNVINSFNAECIYIYSPHSEKTLKLIKNSIAIEPFEYFKQTKYDVDYFIALPDDGAYKHFSDSIPYTPLICKKKRDIKTNQLSGFEISNPEVYNDKSKDILLIDDLCDGGGTFCGLYEEIKKLQPNKISLFISHAIQIEGIEKVAKLYDNVFITNTYKEWQEEKLPQNVHILIFDFSRNLSEKK